MRLFEKRKIHKTFIVLGFLILILGLIIHSWIPTEIGNSNMSSVSKDGENYIKDLTGSKDILIKPNMNTQDNGIKISLFIYLMSEGEIDCTVLILNDSNYNRFKSGSSLTKVEYLKRFERISEGFAQIREEFFIENENSIHILIINNSDFPLEINYFYYYSITPLTYFIGLLLISIGIFILIITLIWYLKNWKRYLIIGIGINLGFFLLAVLNLPNYIITPDIFLELFHIEMYSDFKFFYIEWIAELREGYLPYTENYFNYIYGPLFVLTLGLFSFLPIPIWSIALPFLLSVFGTGYFVFLIVFKITNNNKRAIYSMMAYFLNPFTLLYSSYLWINPSIFVFFVVLSFYFALVEQKYLSIISLGIATMYKQFAIIFFPILILLLIKQRKNVKFSNNKSFPKIKALMWYSFIYGAVLLSISLPFLLTIPDRYIFSFFFTNTTFYLDSVTTINYNLSYPVNFNMFFILISLPKTVTDFIGLLLIYYVFLGSSLLAIYLYFLRYKKYRTTRVTSNGLNTNLITMALFLSMLVIICVHLFYPRGSYKFYLILLTPFISIFFDMRDVRFLKCKENFHFKKKYLMPIIISWIIFFCYRYVYFMLLLAWLFYFIVILYRYKD